MAFYRPDTYEMDPKLFEQQLRELAEIQYDEETGGWVIKKLKPCEYFCDRCQKSVSSTQCNSTYVTRIVNHWRHHCKGCSNYLDPRTHRPMGGKLSSAANTIIGIVREMRAARGIGTFKKTKRRRSIDITTEQQPTEEIVDGEVTIRRYDREDAK